MSSISSFFNFLRSGSFDPAFEQKIYTLDEKEDLIETKFENDNYTYRDINQLQVLIANQVPRIALNDSHTTYTCTIHDQVNITFPNVKPYNEIYFQFLKYAGLSKLIALAGTITLYAISVLKNRSFVALRNWSILSIGAVGVGFLWRRASRASFLYKKTKFEAYDVIKPYAEKIIKIRQQMFKTLKYSDFTVNDSKKAISPVEQEIRQIFAIHNNCKKDTQSKQENTQSSRKTQISLMDVLGFDTTYPFGVKESVLTPELKAINNYLIELVDSEWMQKTVDAFKKIILDGKWVSSKICAEQLEKIPYEFPLRTCLGQLSEENQQKVINHLDIYLDGRKERKENVVLSSPKELAEVIQTTKKSFIAAMHKVAKKYEIPLQEISSENPFWKEAGINPDFTLAEPKKTDSKSE